MSDRRDGARVTLRAVRRRLGLSAALAAVLAFALCGTRPAPPTCTSRTTARRPRGLAASPAPPMARCRHSWDRLSPFPAGSTGIFALAFTPDGDRAVRRHSCSTGASCGLATGPGGVARCAGGADPYALGDGPGRDARRALCIRADPDLPADRPGGRNTGYSIGVGGSLTALSGSPFSSGEFGDVAISDGRFLFAVGPRPGAAIRRQPPTAR